MAASLCGQEMVYIRAILRDFGASQSQPTLVYEDHLACRLHRALIATSTNPVRRKYSRHIDIPRHHIRELSLSGLVKLIPLRAHHMVEDALIKSLPAPGLARHRLCKFLGALVVGREREPCSRPWTTKAPKSTVMLSVPRLRGQGLGHRALTPSNSCAQYTLIN